jgi:succinate dehydrogenase/fumarate reductase flavoprotein subunit
MAMSSNRKGPKPVSRRNFLKTTVAKGTAGLAVAAAGLHSKKAEAAGTKWAKTADVVVVGAGVSGLACACAASDTGSSVIMIEENFDIGGRGIMSGGSIQLGGGHSLQKKYGTVDTADMIFADWTRHDHPASRYSDRDIVRKFADENAATFEFLLAHGVQFTGREEAERPRTPGEPTRPWNGTSPAR